MQRTNTFTTQASQEFRVSDAYSYDHRGPVRWLMSHVLRYPWLLSSFLICALLTNVLFSAVPRLTGVAFDAVLRPEPNLQRLGLISLLLLGMVLLRGAIDLANALSIETIAQRLERDTRDELYASLLGKSQTFHNRQKVGDIMARANNDVRQLNPMFNPGVALIIEGIFGIISPLFFIAFIHPLLLITPALFVLSFLWALRRYLKELTPVSNLMRSNFGVLNASLNESISGIEVVKGAAQEAQEQAKFYQRAKAYRDAFVAQGWVQARYLPRLLIPIALAAAFAQGLMLLAAGAISIGDVVAYMSLINVLRFPTFISLFTFSLVQLGLSGANRMLELIKEDTLLDENVAGYKQAMQGKLSFENVTFRYAGAAQDALFNLSFTAQPGETVAIVGQTGSGKSTLSKLVNRAYDTTLGSVRVDGVAVRDWNLEALRSQIGVIEQDIFLFSRSVAANIAFGLGDKATPAAIEAAAKAAQAHDFIMNFTDGYDTILGERGVTLSGGQRQRLAIARALLTDPRILVLDDATSAIDSATEDAIQKAINKVLAGRTTLLITHRLSQIRVADKIIVLDHGRLIDQGTHGELMVRCLSYQRIFQHSGDDAKVRV